MTYKILIHSLPATGHMNPMAVVVERLVSEYKCHCIWYSFEELREKVEKTGAEFRRLSGSALDEWSPKLSADKKSFKPGLLVNKLLELARNNSVQIAKDFDAEKPDLILYDGLAYHAKWAFRYYETHYKNAERLKARNDKSHLIPTEPLAPLICFETSFVFEEKVFPNEAEGKLMLDLSIFEKLRAAFSLIGCIANVKRLSRELAIEYISPINDLFGSNTHVKKIVATYPGFQARHHLLSKNVKFMGACIDDKVRLVDKNADIERMMGEYPVVNYGERKPNGGNSLVYLSLGTVLDDSLSIYLKIVEALLLIDSKSPAKNFGNLDFILSAGRTCDALIEKYKQLPANILIVKSAPQLAILERAALFVTHCGMNSMNEAIHYAVPTVCIPIGADQPLIAHRATMEFGMGVTLDFVSMKPIDLKEAILTVLSDDGYYERAINASLISRRYNGKINASDEIFKFIRMHKHKI